VFENRFIPNREEVAGGWRRLRNKELHNMYAPPNIRVIKSRRVRWAGHVARMEKNSYTILVGSPVRKIPLGRPKRRW
jgi:hypothetical protein